MITKEEILNLIKLKPDCFVTIIKSKHNELYSLVSNLNLGNSFVEKLYNYCNNEIEFKKCVICDNHRSWKKKFSKGYSNYCSIKCCNRDKTLIEKRMNTYLNLGGIQKKQESDKTGCLKKHGTEFYFQSEETKEKIKSSMIEKYGVENVMQVQHLAEKVLNSFKTKEFIFENEVIIYKGYENIGLEFIKNKTNLKFNHDYFFGIMNMPKIFYDFDRKQRRYYADIYIKSLNLIVEIKSEWTYKYELEKNKAKQNSCITLGYNHEFWICDKNQLLRFINSNGENKSILLSHNQKSQ